MALVNSSFLTIYIPTYRRPVSLIRQLKTLLAQIDSIGASGKDLRLLVRLNGYREHSALLGQLNALRMTSQVLEIVVNPFNIGGNANIALGFIEATTEGYLWLLSDNDYLEEGVLSRVLSAIRRNKPDILILGETDAETKQITRYEDMNSFDHNPLIALGLISRGIYSMPYISSSCEMGFFYHNSSFPHLAVILSAWKKNEYCSILQIQGKAFSRSDEGKGHDYIGNYSLSFAGRVQLISLLPHRCRFGFAVAFLRSGSVNLLRSIKVYPDIAIGSIACLAYYAPKSLLYILPTLVYDLSQKVCLRLFRKRASS